MITTQQLHAVLSTVRDTGQSAYPPAWSEANVGPAVLAVAVGHGVSAVDLQAAVRRYDAALDAGATVPEAIEQAVSAADPTHTAF